jgi:hypothetical protein
LILFHREEEIAAAEGLEIQTIVLIEQNLVHPGFTLVGWKRGQFLILIYKVAKATPPAWPAS